MPLEDSGGRRENQDVFFAVLLQVWGEVNLLAVLQHPVLFGSKGLEAERKKEVGEGQPPSFLMRETKKESIFLSTCLKVFPSCQITRARVGTQRMTQDPLRTYSVEQGQRSLGPWGDVASRRVW